MSSSVSAPRSAALDELPLLRATPAAWAGLAAADLRTFLSDHAVCEQQAALSAMALIGQYPNDPELVERMSALAAEEISHMRRVLGILHRRGWHAAGRRANPWAHGLRTHLKGVPEPWLKVDRLLVGALIEARSCERFTLLHEATGDSEVAALLLELGPAEKRHWQLFYRLAGREVAADALAERFARWLSIENALAAQGGVRATVHG
jgi:tRNA-(ms[2]io[6]A)-hydroxylase